MVEWGQSVQRQCGRVRKCIESERNSQTGGMDGGGGEQHRADLINHLCVPVEGPAV